jgi:hypothetical protein
MEQLALAARVDPQVVVLPKAAAPVPVIVMPVMVRLAVPVLETMTDCAALAVLTVEVKLSGPMGARVTAGVDAAVPVPLRVTACGELEALSAMESDAV